MEATNHQFGKFFKDKHANLHLNLAIFGDSGLGFSGKEGEKEHRSLQ